MLVSELIEELKELPQDLEVMVLNHEWYQHAKITTINTVNEDYDEKNQVIIEID